MPLSAQEEFELLSLEREKSLATPAPAAQAAPQPELAPVDPRRRALQSLPRSLAFSPDFERATSNLGSVGDIGKGAYELGGQVTDLTGSPLAGTAARMIPDLASMAAGGLGGRTVAPAMEGTAKWLMQNSMRATPQDLLAGKAQRGAQTLLERGISPTNAGMLKLKQLGEDLNKAVSDLISGSGQTVSKGEAASGIQNVISKIEATNPVPNQARSAAEGYYNGFMKNKLVPENMPVEQAQALKQGLYKILKDQYGKLNLAGQAEGQAAKTLSQKALASGLKEKIESVIPGVKPLNEEASKIWNALNVSERQALKEANKDIVGMSLLPHNPLAMLGIWANRSAAFKSGLAKILYMGKDEIPAAAGGAVGTAAYEASQAP